MVYYKRRGRVDGSSHEDLQLQPTRCSETFTAEDDIQERACLLQNGS